MKILNYNDLFGALSCVGCFFLFFLFHFVVSFLYRLCFYYFISHRHTGRVWLKVKKKHAEKNPTIFLSMHYDEEKKICFFHTLFSSYEKIKFTLFCFYFVGNYCVNCSELVHFWFHICFSQAKTMKIAKLSTLYIGKDFKGYTWTCKKIITAKWLRAYWMHVYDGWWTCKLKKSRRKGTVYLLKSVVVMQFEKKIIHNLIQIGWKVLHLYTMTLLIATSQRIHLTSHRFLQIT